MNELALFSGFGNILGDIKEMIVLPIKPFEAEP